ncbi:MAG: C45 family peptidase [Candidatus Latescibacterota bacterium]|jgi:isopenicillin-N N-acyltransferase-like protein|nr:C45 family peptidase [Candidatus Latescibacterota bacterium]
MAELPILEVSGSPEERGRAHGETFGGLIRELVPAFFDDLEQTSKNHSLPVMTRERALEIVATYREPCRGYAADLFEELEGIASAANVSADELLALNAFLELHDYYSDAFVISGCTSLMVPGTTSGEGALIAQNYDLASLFADAAVLIKVKSDDQPDALFYTSAGMLGCSGVNEAGVGVVINNLVPSDSTGGVIYPFIIRKILQSVRIGDAIDAVVAQPRASGMNYVLCDENGEIYDLETTAKEYEVTCPFDGPMAHANHYLMDRLKPFERRQWDARGQSILRWGRATRLLKSADNPDAGTLRDILSDRVNAPIGICRHNEVTHGEACGQTIAGIVLDPPGRRAWFTKGPTGQNSWQELSVG